MSTPNVTVIIWGELFELSWGLQVITWLLCNGAVPKLCSIRCRCSKYSMYSSMYRWYIAISASWTLTTSVPWDAESTSTLLNMHREHWQLQHPEMHACVSTRALSAPCPYRMVQMSSGNNRHTHRSCMLSWCMAAYVDDCLKLFWLHRRRRGWAALWFAAIPTRFECNVSFVPDAVYTEESRRGDQVGCIDHLFAAQEACAATREARRRHGIRSTRGLLHQVDWGWAGRLWRYLTADLVGPFVGYAGSILSRAW